jgi:hypothetical protein
VPVPTPPVASTDVSSVAVLVAAGVGALLLLIGVQWFYRLRPASLRRWGYLPGPEPGEWTARLDPMAITWRPGIGFKVRLGVYKSAELRMRPRGADPRRADSFDSGEPELDARWRFASESPAYARELLARPGLISALRSFPALPVDLRGDELIVEVRKRSVPRSVHDAVLQLALALAETRYG